MTSQQPLKIIFAGTPEFAEVALQALLDAGHNIVAVYCQPDRPSGRGKKIVFGPVKQLAVEHNIPVEQPLNFKVDGSLERLRSYGADLMIVVAYGLLLPQSVLTTPRYGCINIHGSLLPRWRGAAPIQRAIEAGDKQSGITIMQMDKGLDTGNMLLKKDCPILPDDTGSTLHDKLAILGGAAITEFLANFDPLDSGEIQQDSEANYAHKLSKQEAQIDWSQSAIEIAQKVRAYNAWPVCYTFVGQNRMRIWQAQWLKTTKPINEKPGTVVDLGKLGIDVVCGDGQLLRVTELQADGSKRMDAAALLNARKDWFIEHPCLGNQV
ncbi:methionyl-tRNA formyltransferase [Aliikangiella maris]|uniref:Methionyl-tRNA formyltransferase n=2 Tax=Aliikangiella maris TaxID=3162458 RepID=A0ABV2BWZ7_9GAMM